MADILHIELKSREHVALRYYTENPNQYRQK